MPDTAALPEKRKRRLKRRVINTDARMYYGVPVPVKGVCIPFPKDAVDRLVRIESNSQRRAWKYDDAIVKPVDFIAVCYAQDWKCSICREPINPLIGSAQPDSISVEHNPALSVCHEHSKRTVEAAHLGCNCEKNNAGDTGRAAKIKRVQSDEERHANRMQAKATLAREVYRRKLAEEARLKGNRAIKNRSDLPKAGEGAKLRGAGFQKPPEGYKYQWGKR